MFVKAALGEGARGSLFFSHTRVGEISPLLGPTNGLVRCVFFSLSSCLMSGKVLAWPSIGPTRIL